MRHYISVFVSARCNVQYFCLPQASLSIVCSACLLHDRFTAQTGLCLYCQHWSEWPDALLCLMTICTSGVSYCLMSPGGQTWLLLRCWLTFAALVAGNCIRSDLKTACSNSSSCLQSTSQTWYRYSSLSSQEYSVSISWQASSCMCAVALLPEASPIHHHVHTLECAMSAL